jgi:hypothetical protein
LVILSGIRFFPFLFVLSTRTIVLKSYKITLPPSTATIATVAD